MLWILGKYNATSAPWSDDRKPLLACCLDCAETVKRLWPEPQKKKIASAVQVLRNWVANAADVKDAKQARSDLSAAAADVATNAAADVAWSAANAAAAAAAGAAAAAADAAANDAADAADAAKIKSHAETADIVRRYFPNCPI